MVLVWYEIKEVNEDEADQTESDTSESETAVEGSQERLTVYIDHKSVREVAGVYGLDIEQVSVVEEMMGAK